MSKYRIVTIDGGGIRGIITTILLQRIVATPGLENFLETIDLLAGTSTGGLLSLGISHGISLERIRELYEKSGPEIFADTCLDNIRDLGKLLGADYSIRRLRRELNDIFGSTTLGQLKKRVLITTFDLDNEDQDPAGRTWKPKLFHNFPGENSDEDAQAADVGLYTSAAPTYFPSVDGYIDGGVYAVNPSVCALAQTQDRRYRPNPPLRNILLFSLGTGTSLQYIKGKSLDWGYLQWIKPLIDLIFDGTAGIADYQCRQFLGPDYHRLAPVFPPGVKIPMDGVKKIPEMISFAESLDMESTLRWLKETWNKE
ncbi:MAG TPA: patatin-like phospholipase family protein [Bacteroidales bacterium]|jgi:patatin-like phospholipase/acyl hydrolase|nr:patatin-like phospholipase family protein [Bacteroidales bacterium]HOS72257.1 patatin-like phospholipase family protein [Bacteroidales bacterium]HQH24988.1 patatin-like phospholipase family protein [Bacteroidales bacterium]HQJ82601.1 patatin-like phospholipase family protein [Bacteroidales bacterium]